MENARTPLAEQLMKGIVHTATVSTVGIIEVTMASVLMNTYQRRMEFQTTRRCLPYQARCQLSSHAYGRWILTQTRRPFTDITPPTFTVHTILPSILRWRLGITLRTSVRNPWVAVVKIQDSHPQRVQILNLHGLVRSPKSRLPSILSQSHPCSLSRE